MNALLLPKPVSFEWDKGNLDKNLLKHNVNNIETEQIFYNNPLVLGDMGHSSVEDRYLAFGITNQGRFLFVVFTIRTNKIRIISARDQDKKERSIYEQYSKNT